MDKEYQVTMLGPRGVGKTSILAGMYDQFESVDGLDFGLIATSTTSQRLNDKVAVLKSQLDEFEATTGLDGTTEITTFDFSLNSQYGGFDDDITFTDIPGEHYNNEKKALEKIVKKNDVIVVAIDSPALMEKGGDYNKSVNKPLETINFIRRAMKGSHKPKLVILVPVKCETYLKNASGKHDPNNATKLLAKVEKEYKSLINFVSAKDDSALLIAPIQTLGNVRFSHYITENAIPMAQFFYTSGEKYAPKNVEQVLFYILGFHLHNEKMFLKTQSKKLDDERWWFSKLFGIGQDKIDELIASHEKRDKILEKLIKKYNTNNQEGFKVVTGHSSLGMPPA